MKLTVPFFMLILVASLSFLPPNSHCWAAATIKGVISNKMTGEPLPGANILIQGTSIGAASDLKGHFFIPKVPPGTYRLIVTYIGYKKEIREIKITGDQPEVIQDISLQSEAVQGQTVVITAQAEGQIAAINQQLTAPSIVNIVSSARIQELPDANAAESVGRLPGISIVRDAGEGQKVAIRGLAPKYNVVTVNGVRVPATDLGDRSVDMNMISPNMLAGIEVIKALTPDKDADAIGGSVDFKLSDAPSQFKSTLLLQGGYNSLQDNFKPFKAVAGASNRFFKERLGIMLQGNFDQADRGSDNLNAGYVLQRERLEGEEYAPIQITNLTLLDRSEMRKRYGFSLIMDYKFAHSKLNFSNFANRLDRDIMQRQDRYNPGERSHEYVLLQRLIATDVISNSLGGEHDFTFAKVDWNLAHALSLQHWKRNDDFSFSEASAFTNDLRDDQGPRVVFETAKNNLLETSLMQSNLRTAKGEERDLSAQLNVEFPFVFSRQFNGAIKFGGKIRYKSRSIDNQLKWIPYYYGWGADSLRRAFPEKQLAFTPSGWLGMENFYDPGYRSKNFLDGNYALAYALDRDILNEVIERIGHLYLQRLDADANDYENDETIPAGYVMAKVNIGKRLFLLPGMRFEAEQTDFTAQINTVQLSGYNQVGDIQDTTSHRSFDHWFPMMHLRYKITDWLDLRTAYTRTISRPNFGYISPYVRINSTGGTVSRGTPYLKPAIATNFDVALSTYTNKFGLISLAGFYKEIDNLFYSKTRYIRNPAQENLPPYTKGYKLNDYVNNPHPTFVRGFEIDIQTHFWWLPGILKGLILNANYSRISTTTQYPVTYVKREILNQPPWSKLIDVDTTRTGRMILQPNDVANIAIGYDIGGFSGRLSLLFQGNTLSEVGDRDETDGFTEDYLRWDLSMKMDIARGLQLYFNLNNISNRPDVAYQPTEGFLTSKAYYGLTGDLGLRYSF